MAGGVGPAICEAEAEFAEMVATAAKSVGAKGEWVLSTSPARGLHHRAGQIEADQQRRLDPYSGNQQAPAFSGHASLHSVDCEAAALYGGKSSA